MTDTVEQVTAREVQAETTALALHGADPTGFLSIIRTAAENKTDPATMRELLNVYKDAQAQRAEEAYAEAIVQFRRMVRPIIMTGHRDDRRTGGQVHYDYAELTTTIEQIQPVLDQCQLTPTWRTVKDEPGYISLECVITHILKHKESSGPFGSPVGEGRKGQTPVQVRQGVVTSLKRATMFMALGLTTKEDDRDLADAEKGDEPKQAPKPPSDDAEATAKKDFWNAAQRKAGVKFTADQARAIFAKVQEASGKSSAVECLSFLSKETVLLSEDGVLSFITDPEPTGDPFADQAPAAAPASQTPSTPEAAPQPPSSDMQWECDECSAKYPVKTAGGKCMAKGCLGHVQKVK